MIVFSYSVVHSDVLKYWACAITRGQRRYHLPFPLPHLRQASVIKPTLGLLWTWKRLGKLSLLSRCFSPTDCIGRWHNTPFAMRTGLKANETDHSLHYLDPYSKHPPSKLLGTILSSWRKLKVGRSLCHCKDLGLSGSPGPFIRWEHWA